MRRVPPRKAAIGIVMWVEMLSKPLNWFEKEECDVSWGDKSFTEGGGVTRRTSNRACLLVSINDSPISATSLYTSRLTGDQVGRLETVLTSQVSSHPSIPSKEEEPCLGEIRRQSQSRQGWSNRNTKLHM